jgi:CBS domain-containing protein
MRVADVMTEPVRTVAAGETASVAWEQMRLHGTRHLVVVGLDGQVVGVLSVSDLGGRHGERLRQGRLVSDLMTDKIVAATPETTVREAANLMRGNRVNCLPVLAGRKLRGIITALDLLELIGRGVERPVARTERYVLKDRGPRPHRQTIAKDARRRVK